MFQTEDIGQLKGQENMTHIYMLSTKDPSQNKRYTNTKSKRMKKYSMQIETNKQNSWGSNNYIRQNTLQNKGCNKRQRRTLHT